jgi:arabinosaccharide transport system substrate-binding protein
VKKVNLIILLIVCLSIVGLNPTLHVRAQKEVTFTAWTHDQLYIDYFKTRTAEWEAAHPDLKVTWDFVVKPDAGNAVLQALAAGEPIPDLLGIEQGAFPNFMKDGVIEKYFVDLTDLIKDPAEYSQGRMAIYSFNGKLFALESQLAASVLYYQPKIYTDNGLEVPKTWEDMLAAGDILGPKGISQAFATDDGSFFQMLFNQRGGAIFDKDAKFVLGDETNRPLAIEVATFIQNAVKNKTFMVVLGGDVWSGATIPTAYQSGKLSGTVMPDWWSSCCLQPGVKDMAGQWAVAVPPVWKAGGHKTLTWGGTGWAVSNQSPNADLAKDFLAFAYLGTESQVLKFKAINNFPWMLSAYKDSRVSELADPFYGGQKLGEIYGQVAEDVPAWYQSPFRASYAKAAADNLPLLFTAEITPEQFVDNVVKTTQDAIDFGN